MESLYVLAVAHSRRTMQEEPCRQGCMRKEMQKNKQLGRELRYDGEDL